MNTFSHKYNPEQLSPEELSIREHQLLKTHLNAERAARWKQLAGPKPTQLQIILKEKKWIWLVVIALLGAAICWQAGWFLPVLKDPNPTIAARTDLIPYPFDNIAVRGEQDQVQKIVRPAKALAAYRNNDFATAIRESSPNDPYFVGICWLQMHEPQKALAAFEQVSTFSDEFYYYKGVALQDLGRNEEAKALFEQALDSKTLRETYREAVVKRIKN